MPLSSPIKCASSIKILCELVSKFPPNLRTAVIVPVVVKLDAPSLMYKSATVAVTKTTAVPLSVIALSELELSVTERVSVVPLDVYVPLPISKLLPSSIA